VNVALPARDDHRRQGSQLGARAVALDGSLGDDRLVGAGQLDVQDGIALGDTGQVRARTSRRRWQHGRQGALDLVGRRATL